MASRDRESVAQKNIILDAANSTAARVAAKEKELNQQILLNRRMPRLQRAIREGLRARLESLVKQAEERDRTSEAKHTVITKREASVDVHENAIRERESALKMLEKSCEEVRIQQVTAGARAEDRLRSLERREQQNEDRAQALSRREAAAEMLQKSGAADLVAVTKIKAQLGTERRDLETILKNINDAKRKLDHGKMMMAAREASLRMQSAKLAGRELTLDEREGQIQEREDKALSEERRLAAMRDETKNVKEVVEDMRKKLDASRFQIVVQEADLKEREAVVESFVGREAKLARREEEQDSREDEFFERSAVEVSRVHRRERIALERLCTQQQDVIRTLKARLETGADAKRTEANKLGKRQGGVSTADGGSPTRDGGGTKGESPAIRALEESRDVIAGLLKPLVAKGHADQGERAKDGSGESRQEEVEPGKAVGADLDREKGSTIYVSVKL